LCLEREELRCTALGTLGVAMRRFGLAATLAAVIVLLSASAALAPPTNKDELLKDELETKAGTPIGTRRIRATATRPCATTTTCTSRSGAEQGRVQD
jgi:hypothetical protein